MLLGCMASFKDRPRKHFNRAHEKQQQNTNVHQQAYSICITSTVALCLVQRTQLDGSPFMHLSIIKNFLFNLFLYKTKTGSILYLKNISVSEWNSKESLLTSSLGVTSVLAAGKKNRPSYQLQVVLSGIEWLKEAFWWIKTWKASISVRGIFIIASNSAAESESHSIDEQPNR